MALNDVHPESVRDNPPDEWRHVGEVVSAALDMPVRDSGAMMFAIELMARSCMLYGATPGQVKRMIIALRPGDIGILSHGEITNVIRRLGLERA